jgi:N-acylneuraminate cytidylyltransferase/CMP-N,N'-diacetyllegionaminic acid synthase
VIAIIPARGGSKGLPGKNIKHLLGKPLIQYTIEAALQAKHVSDVIISTDDKETYRIAVECGCRDTFLRKSSLAQDGSLAVDNYIYTIERLNNEFRYCIEDFIVLQPTSPLRESVDIDNAIELFIEKNADSVISYTEEYHPITWHKYVNGDGRFESIFPDNIQNRQENRPSYFPNGAIYVFNYDLIKQKKYYSEKTYAYLMSREKSVDIDTVDDFDYAEYVINKMVGNYGR